MKQQENDVIYYEDHRFPSFEGKHDTKISVVNNDTFTLAHELLPATSCCLNFASHKRPGGGYKSVIRADVSRHS